MQFPCSHSRRAFLKHSLISGVSFLYLPSLQKPPVTSLNYSIDHIIPTRLFDGNKCWVHPRAGIVPGGGTNDLPRLVMTMNTLDLEGSDVFKGMFGLESDNLGKTWTEVEKIDQLAPRFEVIDGIKRPIAASDFWPMYHHRSKRLLGIGHTVVYTPEWKVTMPRPRHTSYSIYDVASRSWSEWQKLELPRSPGFRPMQNTSPQILQLEKIARKDRSVPESISHRNLTFASTHQNTATALLAQSDRWQTQ